ncbi:MAG: type II toxin-antitoxin system VapC family toxin [Ilumatobacteraceae bacterium]
MITYFDTSAFIKLIIDEIGTDEVESYWDDGGDVSSCQLLVVESTAALVRAHQVDRISFATYNSSISLLDDLYRRMEIVSIDENLLAEACAVTKLEKLRAYDAVHLAAALKIGATVFASADVDLCHAANRQGLTVFNPGLN